MELPNEEVVKSKEPGVTFTELPELVFPEIEYQKIIITLSDGTATKCMVGGLPAGSRITRVSWEATPDQIQYNQNQILEQREEILKAFIAKYCCDPDQVVQKVQNLGDKIIWWVEWKPQPSPFTNLPIKRDRLLTIIEE